MSSGAGFPINDLLRRPLQTGLTITTLTLSVASTLFLLHFSSQLDRSISASGGMFTLGLMVVFNQYLTFIGALIFLVGVVLTSFIVFLMMKQRTRDFGLIKAAGCPNSLVGGYFLSELIITVTVGCSVGSIVGFAADFVASYLLFGSFYVANWWFVLVIFGVFFGSALFFGLQPILKASRLSAVEALSPVQYYGLLEIGNYKALSRRALAWRIASRSMARRLNPISRIVVLLSVVFILLTVTVAGGIIARDTTTSWVQKSHDGNTLLVAHNSLGNQYIQLLSRFSGAANDTDFNYSSAEFAIFPSVTAALTSLPGISSVQERLILNKNVTETGNFTFIDGGTYSVGGNREGNSIIIGVNPADLATDLSSKGRSLDADGAWEAGDSIVQTMYTVDNRLKIRHSDPLVQGIMIEGKTFQIVGLCVDPLNNGFVTYVPIKTLRNATGLSSPNMLWITLDNTADRAEVTQNIRNTIKSIDSDLEIFDLTPINDANTMLLSSTWGTIMFIALFSVASAAICLVSYMMLSINEQRHEFAAIRLVGARPRLIISMCAIESLLVLLSSLGIGLSFGIPMTVLILMAEPLISNISILTIAACMGLASAVMFIISLYPAIKLSKTSILQINR